MEATKQLVSISPIFILLYLYSGIYKETLAIPYLDMTLIMLVASVFIVHFSSRLLYRDFIRERSVVAFGILLVYLFLRIKNYSFADFGIYKLSISAVLGVSALYFGYFLASKRRILISFFYILLISGVCTSTVVIYTSITSGNITSTNDFIDGGYQLTGNFIAISVIAGLILLCENRYNLFWYMSSVAINTLALSLIGSVPSFVFCLFAMLMLILAFLFTKSYKFSGKISLATLLAVLIITVFSSIYTYPSSLYRAIWKLDVAFNELGLDMFDEKMHQDFDSSSGRRTIKLLPPEEKINYVDRIELYRYAIKESTESPVFGNGFGEFMYKGVRTPHNLFIELLYEAGLVSVILFLTFNYYIFTSFFKFKKTDPVLEYGVLSLFIFEIMTYMVGGFFIGRLLMFSYGLILGLNGLSKRNEPTTSTI